MSCCYDSDLEDDDDDDDNDFSDQTNCTLGWFGYNGNCYQHFFASDSETYAEICANVNSIMTSLTSLDELEMLEDYLQSKYHL